MHESDLRVLAGSATAASPWMSTLLTPAAVTPGPPAAVGPAPTNLDQLLGCVVALTPFVLEGVRCLLEKVSLRRQLSAAQQKRATVAEPELVSEGPP